MARRRGNNEGSIYQRKDGLWCAQVSLEGRRLTKYARTQRECREWIKGTLSLIDGGLTFSGTRVTMKDYLDNWLSGKEVSKRPKTVTQYTQIVNQYLVPGLGKIRLKDLKAEHVRSFYWGYREDTGQRTLQLIHAVLNAALNQAVREGLLGRNPVDAVDRPIYDPAERKVLDTDQVRQLLKVVESSRNEALYLMAIVTGMRGGELLGLKWEDISWKEKHIQVQRQVQYVKGQGLIFMSPKTKAGKRRITISKGVLVKLDNHREQQALEKQVTGDRWQEYGLIFPSTVGTPQEWSNLLRGFKRILEEAGLPKIHFHDLRHTSISMLLDQGVSINTVQRRAGHTKASTTTNIYGHSINGADEKVGQIFDGITQLQ